MFVASADGTVSASCTKNTTMVTIPSLSTRTLRILIASLSASAACYQLYPLDEPLAEHCTFDGDCTVSQYNLDQCMNVRCDRDRGLCAGVLVDLDGDGLAPSVCVGRRYRDYPGDPRDCNDTDPRTRPGADERCNGIDDDCDGNVDEGILFAGYADRDNDGSGDVSKPVEDCSPLLGVAERADDCNDADPEMAPGKAEACDGKDNDCDELVDEEASALNWFRDDDGDGFGTGDAQVSCKPLAGFALRAGDCNDSRAGVYPGATEVCDGVDTDCDGHANFMLASGDSEDDDGDSIPDRICASSAGDCDDRDPRALAVQVETCNGLDDDCDGLTDEEVPHTVMYVDLDGDGFGAAASGTTLSTCQPIAGYALLGDDCDDRDRQRNPGHVEVCDGLDNDCDYQTDENSTCIADAGEG